MVGGLFLDGYAGGGGIGGGGAPAAAHGHVAIVEGAAHVLGGGDAAVVDGVG